jgi:hypothetical protein
VGARPAQLANTPLLLGGWLWLPLLVLVLVPVPVPVLV